MLEEIYRWGRGAVEFRMTGNCPRLVTLAARQGLVLWGYRPGPEGSSAWVLAGSYHRLRPLCRRAGAVCRITRKAGLPFWSRKLLGRKGLVAGALAAGLLYWYLSGCLWGIAVSGEDAVTQRQILDAAESRGVRLGVRLSDLEPRLAARGILREVEGLTWAAVNTDGCFAQIAVREGDPEPEREQVEEWSNIVAGKEGQVVEITAEEGRAEVKVGDVVTKGQLLISGLYEQVPDPYGPQPNIRYQRAGASRGSVVAETYREFTVTVGATAEALQPQGEPQRQLYLELFGLRLPLGLWTAPPQDSLVWEERSPVKALDTELPLAWNVRTVQPRTRQVLVLTEEEQRDRALLSLRNEQREQLPQGAQILEEELEFGFSSGGCTLTARCRCREEIGVVQPVLGISPS